MAETNEIRTQLRIPADLHARITEAAKDSGRSMNAEIVQRLETSFQVDKSSAFELLKKAMDVIDSSQKALKAHEEDIARFIAGESDALRWLDRADHSLSDQEIVNAARQVADVFRSEIRQARGYVPVLISTVQKGGPIPEGIRQFLSRA